MAKRKKDRQYNDQKKERQYNGQKKDGQYNGQKKDGQYNGHKTLHWKLRIEEHQPHNYYEDGPLCSGRISSSYFASGPVMLLLNDMNIIWY